MCGSPLQTKLREFAMPPFGNHIDDRVNVVIPTLSPQSASTGMLMGALYPLFQRVKGFLVDLVYAIYDHTPDTRALKSIEYISSQDNNNTMATKDTDGHCAIDTYQALPVDMLSETKSSLLECVLLDLPQYKPTDMKVVVGGSNQQQTGSANYFWKSPKQPSSTDAMRRKRVTHSSNNKIMADALEVMVKPNAVKPRVASPIRPRFASIKSSRRHASKNNREKMRHELAREIHEDVCWNASDEQDVVDGAPCLLDSVISFSFGFEPLQQIGCDKGVRVVTTNMFTACFSVDDFPAMSSDRDRKKPATPSPDRDVINTNISPPATTTIGRKGISWTIPLDRPTASPPARLARFAVPPKRKCGRQPLQSECESEDSSAKVTQLSITNVHQFKVQFNATRAPRERQISECSDDFICFEGGAYGDDDDDDDRYDDFDDDESYDESSCSDSDSDNDDAVTTIDATENHQFDSGFEETKQHVRFNLQAKVHVLHAWRFAYEHARKSTWEQIGRDRVRFQDKVRRLAEVLNPILDAKHRRMVRKRLDDQHRRTQCTFPFKLGSGD